MAVVGRRPGTVLGPNRKAAIRQQYAEAISPKLSKERAEQQLASQRARLIEGLAEAIREKGLANTKVDDIVGNARASRATFYRCFEDKEACYVALAEEMLETTRGRVAQAVDPSAPAPTQVDQSVDAFLAILEEDHAVTVTLSNELPRLGPRGAQLRAESIERYAAFMFALVHNPHIEAQMGRLPHVTIETCVMVICGIEGLMDRAVRRDEDLRLLAPHVKLVIKRVLAPERRAITGK